MRRWYALAVGLAYSLDLRCWPYSLSVGDCQSLTRRFWPWVKMGGSFMSRTEAVLATRLRRAFSSLTVSEARRWLFRGHLPDRFRKAVPQWRREIALRCAWYGFQWEVTARPTQPLREEEERWGPYARGWEVILRHLPPYKGVTLCFCLQGLLALSSASLGLLGLATRELWRAHTVVVQGMKSPFNAERAADRGLRVLPRVVAARRRRHACHSDSDAAALDPSDARSQESEWSERRAAEVPAPSGRLALRGQLVRPCPGRMRRPVEVPEATPFGARPRVGS